MAAFAMVAALGGASSPTIDAWLAGLSVASWFIGFAMLLRSFGLVTPSATKTVPRILAWWINYSLTFCTVAITLFGLPLAWKYTYLRPQYIELLLCSWAITLFVHFWGASRRRFARSGGAASAG